MKLYWRIKISGKWTWRPAEVQTYENEEGREFIVTPYLEEEE